MYIALALTFGLTLMMMETAIGRKTGKSCIDAFHDLCERYTFIGYITALVPIIILSYYCVIGGWVLKYFMESVTGNLDTLSYGGEGSGPYWWDYISGEATGSVLDPTIWFILFAAACMFIVSLGVKRGVEGASRILMPLLLLMLVVVTVFTFTLDGIGDGLEFYLIPKADDFSPRTLLAAVSQVFYSLSLSAGVVIAYGSYMKKDVNIERSARSIVMMDIGVAFISGLMIVPAAFAFGFEDKNGMGLMFEALPRVFSQMPGGEFVAPIFFLLVVFAAITSAMSMAESGVSMFIDHVHVSRRTSVLIVSAITMTLGVICCLGFGPWMTDVPGDQGAGWLGIFDTITNSFLMPVVAILACIFVGYVIKTTVLEEEIELNGEFRMKKVFRVMIRYVCPVLLLAILGSGIYSTYFM